VTGRGSFVGDARRQPDRSGAGVLFSVVLVEKASTTLLLSPSSLNLLTTLAARGPNPRSASHREVKVSVNGAIRGEKTDCADGRVLGEPSAESTYAAVANAGRPTSPPSNVPTL